uniref:Uncharacterized protein n=1 Tax=Human betaherpesvirus 6 TaxID=10368 RepID=A0A5P9V2F8_9BETA|nr:hypothetical protein [Human betaherpesvirus 6]QFV47809.1 hypothetical protein [Human betaherpesvirus 6]QFV49811.1 hypothetical protein [Human betaherpesvirus 6]QFX16088.1 hypothetical protein [Human betaherpesvirus 6]QFX43722.1 hypothetical protein [Human betaherpesvirus 6]
MWEYLKRRRTQEDFDNGPEQQIVFRDKTGAEHEDVAEGELLGDEIPI